jgi:hypothetical protein
MGIIFIVTKATESRYSGMALQGFLTLEVR